MVSGKNLLVIGRWSLVSGHWSGLIWMVSCRVERDPGRNSFQIHPNRELDGPKESHTRRCVGVFRSSLEKSALDGPRRSYTRQCVVLFRSSLEKSALGGPRKSYTRQCVVLFRSSLERRATPLLFFQQYNSEDGDAQYAHIFERASESVTLR